MRNLRKGIALALAVALVVTTLTFTAGNSLKASNDEDAYKTEEKAEQSKETQKETEKATAAQATKEVKVDKQEATSANENVDKTKAEATEASNGAESTKNEKKKSKASFSKRASNGVSVSVSAPEGALYDDTTMSVSSVSKASAISYAKKILTNVTDAEGVQIKFKEEGKSVEPDKSVSVSLSGASVEGQSFVLLHVKDNGSVERVGSASANGASFKASDFSSYIIAGISTSQEEAETTATDNNDDNDNVTVKGDSAASDDEDSTQGAEEKTTKSVTVTYNANGGNGSVSSQKVTLGNDGKASISLTNNAFAKSGYNFVGWSTNKAASSGLTEGTTVTIAEDTTYYAIWQKSSGFGISLASDTMTIQSGSYDVNINEQVTITGTASAATNWSSRWGDRISESWSSSNESIAKVAGSGSSAVVTGVAEGSITITHTYCTKSGSAFGTSYTTKIETFTVNVIDNSAFKTPVLTLSKSNISLTKKGETSIITATVKNKPEVSILSWKSSDEKVAKVKDGTVTAVSSGTATITATLEYEDENEDTQTITAKATVTVKYGEYKVYCYALIPGCNADGSGSADESWYGIGIATIKGVADPSTLSVGTTVSDYEIGSATKALYPDINYNGVTYKYAAAGSAEASEQGYYTISPYRVTVASGANAGKNGYNTPGVSAGINTWHYDYVMSINDKATCTASFAVSYPEDNNNFVTLTDYAQRVKAGTSESSLNKPSSSVVPEMKTYNGLTYKFDGWYTDSSCTSKANFSGTLESNITYYAKYTPTNQKYTVEYYYDGVKDSSATVTAGPVDIGSKIITYTDKPKKGYRFSSATVSQNNPLTISENASENVIKVYYIKRQLGYIVNYYINGTTEKITDSVSAAGNYGETVSGELKDVEGYTAVDPSTKTKYLELAEDSTEINFYYYKNVKLTANNATKTYSGKEQSVEGYTTNANADATFPVTVSAKGTAVGTYTADASSAVGAIDNSGKYKITEAQNGKLVIEKAKVTVNTPDASKEYDGDPLIEEGSVEGIAENDEYTFETTGSQTEVGSSENSYTLTFNDSNVEDNYDIQATVGTLTVNKKNVDTIVVNVDNITAIYDGKAHGSNVVVKNLPEGWTAVNTESTEKATNVSDGKITATCGSITIKNEKGNVVYQKADGIVKINKLAKNEAAVTFNNGSVTITPATLTVDTPDASKTYDGKELTSQGTIGGFVNGETATFETTGTQTAVGSSDNTYKLTFDKSAREDNYTVKASVGKLTVKEYTGEIKVTTVGGTYTYDGEAHGATVNVEGLADGYTVKEATSSATATHVADGTVTADCDSLKIINAAGDDVTNHLNIKKTPGTITINKATLNVTTDTAQRTYNGKALTADGTITGFVSKENAQLVMTGSQTEVGSSANTYSINWTNANESDYTVNENIGTLTVIESDDEITVTTAGGTFTYDGDEHFAKVTVTGLPEGYTVQTAESNAKLQNVGEVTATCDNLVITNAGGKDVTSKLSIKYIDGTLKVTPKTVNIITNSDEKTYDGKALVGSGSIEGLVKNETVTFNVTGSQTEVGETENSYNLAWDGTAKASNYSVSKTVGKLKVKEYAGTIKVKVKGGTFTYDGKEHNATVDVSTLPAGYTLVNARSKASATHVTKEAVEANCDEIKIVNAVGIDVTSRLDISYENDTIVINPAKLTVNTPTADKVYNGNPLTAKGSICGFVNQETATFETTGVQTDVGSSENTYEIKWDGTAKEYDYDVEAIVGTLTVKESEETIVVTTSGGEYTYDGKAHSATVTVSTLPEGYTLKNATSSTTVTDVTDEDVKATCDNLEIINASGKDVTYKLKKNIKYVDGSIKINPANVTVTTPSETKTYDGEALTADGTIAGLVNGETVNFKTTGTQTSVGKSENKYELVWNGTAKESNYTVTENVGTLEVKEYTGKIEVKTVGGEYTYDGKAHGATVTVSDLPKGYTLGVATSSDVATHVSEGIVTASCDNLVIRNAQNEDVTEALNVIETTGTIKINPRTLNVTTESKSKVYDGDALTAHGKYTGLVDGETFTFTVTGTITDVGSETNTYNINWNGSAKSSDYTIKENLGTLIIKENQDEIVVTTTGYNGTYDGQNHRATVNVQGVPTGYHVVTKESNAEAKDVTSKLIKATCDKLKIVNKSGADVTNNLKVRYVDSEINITPATLTVTTPSKSKVYDGEALKAKGSVTGYVNGEEAKFETTGSQTEVGESVNEYKLEFEGSSAKKSNYTIKEKLGKLSVTENDSEISVVTKGGTFTYDGKEHRASVEVRGVPTGYSLVKAESNAKATDVTANPISAKCDVLKIVNNSGKDVTENLNIKHTDDSIVINPAELTVTTPSASKVYDGKALTANGEITGLVKNETVTFKTTGTQTNVGTSKNTYHITWDGTAKESNYKVAEKSVGDLTVTDSEDEIVVTTTGGSFAYDGQAHGGSVTVSKLPEGYEVKEAKSTATVTNVKDGKIDASCDKLVIVNKNGDDVTSKLNIKQVSGTIEVTPATLTVNTLDASKVYDGTQLIADGEISGFIGNESATFKTTGAITNVGSTDNSYEIVWDGTAEESNYTVNETIGKLTVTDYAGEITVKTIGGTYTYDGKAHGAKVEVSKLPAGYTLKTAKSTATVTNVKDGKVEAGCDELVIVNATGTDVTKKLKIKSVKGSIQVVPREITVKTNSANKEYDGESLTAGGSVKGLVGDESVVFKTTGSQLDNGKSDNTYNIKWTEDSSQATASKDNYKVKDEVGTLEVTAKSKKIVITAGSDSKTYDGEALTSDKYTYTDDVLVKGDKLTVTTEGAITNVGETANKVKSYQVKRGDKDVTANYTFGDSKNGALTVSKRDLTLTSASDSKVYDGEPLTNKNVEANGFVKGEGATYNVTGAQSEVGSSDNVFDYTFNDGTYGDNYNVTTITGKLVVTEEKGIVVTITEHSDKAKYDGKKHTVEGYDVTSIKSNSKDTKLYKESDFSFDGDATASGTEAGCYEMQLKPSDFTNNNKNFKNVQFVIVDGSLTIDPVEEEVVVHIAGVKDQVTYDGKEHSVSGYNVTNISNDLYKKGYINVKTEAKASGTEADTYNMGLTDKAFENANGNFTNVKFVVEDGLLEINPIENVIVTITENSNEVVYDGKEHTVAGYTVVSNNKLYSKDDFAFNGTAKAEGTDVGTYNLNVKPADFANNNKNFKTVTFEIVDGALKIDPVTTPITITAASASKMYDGEPLIKDDYDYTSDVLVNGDKLTAEIKGTITNAGSVDNEVTSYKVTKANGDDSTDNYIFNRAINGTLTIDKRNVTLISASDSKTYDGEPLTNNKVTVSGDGFAKGEGATFNVTGLQKQAGSSDNEFTYELNDGTSKDNYKITKQLGKLTIAKKGEVVVTITEHSDRVRYDGNKHTVHGYDVSISNDLYEESYFKFNGDDTVTATDAGIYEMNLKPEDFENTNNDFEDVTFKIVDGQLTIDKTYNLTIHYVNAKGDKVFKDYVGTYINGESFNIQSPDVTGYTPSYRAITSGDRGMPGKNLEYTVVYTANATATTVTPNNANGTGGGMTAVSVSSTNPNGGILAAKVSADGNLTTINDEDIPLAGVDLHCCILHLLIILAALIIFLCYTYDSKKLYRRILELEEKLER